MNPFFPCLRKGTTRVPRVVPGILPGTGAGGGDIVTTRNGHRYIAPLPEAPSHDEDGNLVSDGRWLYTWDGENRLIAMETTPAAVAIGVPKRKLEFAYDGGSRRIRKQLYDWDSGTSSWTLNTERRFIYDQWNLMAEVDGSGNLLKSHVWGMDLSQTMQGAGGVGGLLWSTDHTGSSSESHFAAYDGNGNVTALVEASSGNRDARYDYDAFGRTMLLEGGDVVESNTYRFSTKYEDAETELYYYGYRYYSDGVARWINRDPIGEDGGLNLYAMVKNATPNYIDRLGLEIQMCGNEVGLAEAMRTEYDVGNIQFEKIKGTKNKYKLKGNATYVKGELRGEIVSAMIKSDRTFKIKKWTDLRDHVDVREKVGEFAKKSQFKYQPGAASFNTMLWKYASGRGGMVPQTGVSWNTALNDLYSSNAVKLYAIDCTKACKFAQLAAIVAIDSSSEPEEEMTATYTESSDDWIPGEYGRIALKNEGNLSVDQTGENVIYLGDDVWWGHFGNPGGDSLSLQQWRDKVANWAGNGSPTEVEPRRTHPSKGLDLD